MANAKEFIEGLIKKAGYSGEDVQAITAISGLDSTPVPDTLVEGVNRGLLSIEAAKSHPDVSKHYRGQLFGITDTATKNTLKGAGYTEEEIKAFFEANPDTPGRLKDLPELLNKKYSSSIEAVKAEMAELRKTGGNAAELAAKNKELADLLNQERESKGKLVETFEAEKSEIFKRIETEKIVNTFNQGLSGFDFGVSAQYVKQGIIQEMLQSYDWVLTEAGPEPREKGNPDVKALDDKNNVLTLDAIIQAKAVPLAVKTTVTVTPPGGNGNGPARTLPKVDAGTDYVTRSKAKGISHNQQVLENLLKK